VSQTLPREERRLFALGLRLFAISCLSIMTVFLKLAGEHGVSTPEMMFWRQAFALPVVTMFVWWTAGFASLRTERLKLHGTRTIMGLITMSLTFSSYVLLPLAEATTLGFTVPIFATILSALVLKEATGWHRWGAVLIGFLGVLIVVQPGTGQIPLAGALIGLASAFLIGVMSLIIRQMGRTEAPATTVFYFSLLSLPLMAPALYLFGQWHDATGWLYLAAIGAIGGIGQIALTASLRWAPVSVVIGMDYIALLWSTLAGWLVWEHLPDVATWIGAPLIIGSGLYIAWREHRLQIERAKDIVV
jgi:drug/metabolite transporter (DMT)-like permease